jgi:hypothetical protein
VSFLRTTIATLTGLAFTRAEDIWGPGAFDLAAFDVDAFDTFDGGALIQHANETATGTGLAFTRTTTLDSASAALAHTTTASSGLTFTRTTEIDA